MADRIDRTIVSPAGHHATTGYSHAIKLGNMLFVSGQTGMDSDRKLVGPGMYEQTQRALDNVRAVLEGGGAAWSHVGKLNVYLTDIGQVQTMRDARRDYFEAHGVKPPAITTVGVTGLAAEGALIEIEAVAVLS